MKYSFTNKFLTIITFILLSSFRLGNLMKSPFKDIKNEIKLDSDSDMELLNNDNEEQRNITNTNIENEKDKDYDNKEKGKKLKDSLKEKSKKNKKEETNDENKKKFQLEIDPILEDDYEKYKLISSKFLGPIVPKVDIDCDHLNIGSNFTDEIKKACNITSSTFAQIQIGAKNLDTENKQGRNLICNSETCAPSQGNCNEIGQCICLKGWLDDPNLKVNKFCSYKQKKQMLLFLIEFFAPFGLGFILYGKLFYGVIKLSVFVGLIIIDLISKCILLCGNDRGAKFPNHMTFFYYLILVFWQLFDMTMIGFNKYKDENGMPYLPVEQ